MIHELIARCRSYRRFYQDQAVDMETLRGLVDLARLSASGMNRQPLKYYLSYAPETNAVIFPNLGWAGYLKDWGGPVEGERPAGYIVILGDREIQSDFGVDYGIAAQSIMIGATFLGLGGCMIRNIRQAGLRRALQIPPRFEILMVLALGRPREEVVIDSVGPDGDIRYWRDAHGVHHVPKRSLDEIILALPHE